KLGASVEASGPHDFAVRLPRPRQKRNSRPPHPAPRFVTLRNAPLWDGTSVNIALIWLLQNRNIFCKGARACPQLEDSQADYRVIHRRSADSELTDAPLRPSGRSMGQDQGYFART